MHRIPLISRVARHGLTVPALALFVLGALFVNEWISREGNHALRRGVLLTDANLAASRLAIAVGNVQLALRTLASRPDAAQLQELRRFDAELDPAITRARDAFHALGTDPGVRVDGAIRLVEQLREGMRRWTAAPPASPPELLAFIDDPGRRALRDAARIRLNDALQFAATHRERERVSIFQTFAAQRWVVNAMIVLTGLAAWLLMRQIALAAEQARAANARLADEVTRQTSLLRDLAGHLVSIQEQERSRIARELHDELGSYLTAAKLELARANKIAGLPPTAADTLRRIDGHVTRVIALKREVIEALRPSSLEHLGLTMALQNLCDSVATTLHVPVNRRIDEADMAPDVQLAVYRLVQEALTNAAKYSHATALDVHLQRDGDAVVVRVSDNGRGFDPKSIDRSAHGLRGMRIRVESIGGRLLVGSTAGRGTEIAARFPLLAPTGASTV